MSRQAFKPDIVLGFREYGGENHRADAQWIFHGHQEADAMARKTAKVSAVIILHGTGSA
ncbi:hypothetical protein D3C80_1919580 [compost metagenome]